MKYKYRYKGEVEIHIPYKGTFEPGKEKVYEVEGKLNHPDFEEIKARKKTSSKSK